MAIRYFICLSYSKVDTILVSHARNQPEIGATVLAGTFITRRPPPRPPSPRRHRVGRGLEQVPVPVETRAATRAGGTGPGAAAPAGSRGCGPTRPARAPGSPLRSSSAALPRELPWTGPGAARGGQHWQHWTVHHLRRLRRRRRLFGRLPLLPSRAAPRPAVGRSGLGPFRLPAAAVVGWGGGLGLALDLDGWKMRRMRCG